MRDDEKKDSVVDVRRTMDNKEVYSLDSDALHSAIGQGADAAFLIKVDVINKEISRIGMGRFR